MYNFDNVTDYPYVNKEEILKVLTPYQIFSFYIGKDITLGEVMKSPLRKVDNRPSFSVFRSKYDKTIILYHDFGTGETGNCFEFVIKLFGLSFYDCLVRLVRDFDLKLNYSQSKTYAPFQGYISTLKEKDIKTKDPIRIKIRKFIFSDLLYWKNYGISEEMLKYYKIVAVQALFYGTVIIARSSVSDPIFAYLFYKDGKTTYKVYRPLTRGTRKWFTTTDKSVLQGWDQMPPTGDLLIITKSLKDVMVLRSLGYNGLSMQSEISLIKITVMKELLSRFKTIIMLQDFDHAGVKGVNKMRKMYPTLRYFFIQNFKNRDNGLKDISDYRKEHGSEKTKKLLKYFIYGNE